MVEHEERELPYLFQLRHTKKVKNLVQCMMRKGAAWQDCGDGWQALEATLRLSNWSKERRVILVREAPASAPVREPGKSRRGKPILRLPTVEELSGRPIGPTTATLPDGSQWVFKFVKIACNVASPLGSEENQILPLLRGWFGEKAGTPCTNYQVAFTQSETGWFVEPVAVATPLRVVDVSPDTGESGEPETHDLPGFVEAPAAKDQFTRLVPVYSLEAAAGKWGPETAPVEIDWAEAAGATIKPGMFIARVRGHSMEPKIKDGSWNLFRPCPQGFREGRIVLVQFNSMGDSENGGRFTVKKYHSAKTLSPVHPPSPGTYSWGQPPELHRHLWHGLRQKPHLPRNHLQCALCHRLW